MSAPVVRALASVTTAHEAKQSNKEASLGLHIAKVRPGLPGNVFGPLKRDEFYEFCFVVMKYTDMRPQPHNEFTQFAQDCFPDLSFKGDEQHFGMILVPRDTFKSVIYSVALPLFLIWKNRDIRILLSAHRHDAAKKRLATIKWNIEFNKEYIALVGYLKPMFKDLKWAEDAIIVKGRSQAFSDATIDTCGVDRSVVGSHPDVIIADDVHSEQNIQSALMRDKVLQHLINFYPMLQPGGTMIIPATRWHVQDAYGKLLSNDDEREQKGLKRKYKTLIRSCYLYDEAGKPKGLFFPERLHEEFLADALVDCKPAKFALWYLNKPIADEDKYFDKKDLASVIIKYYYDDNMGLPTMVISGESDVHVLQAIPVRVTMSWDPAGINPNDQSDFHGLCVVGCDPDNRWLIPHAEALKAKPDAVLRRVAAIIMQYEPEVLILESVGQSGTWAYLLRAYMEKEGLHCPPIMLHTPSNKVSKNERIKSLQPKWASNEIIIDRRCRVLIEQLDSFPQLDYDDVLDSLQMHMEYTIPANPESLDLLVDYEALRFQSEHPKNVTPEDPRRKLGAFAGVSSSKWASQEKSGKAWFTHRQLTR